MRAARRRGERSLDQPHRLGLARGRRQGPPERRGAPPPAPPPPPGPPRGPPRAPPGPPPLPPAEPLDQPQQHLEIGLAHRPPRRHHSTGSLPSNSQREKSLLQIPD